MFYPSDPIELRGLVEALLGAVTETAGPPPRALVAPHAGYLYSGPVAASAFHELAAAAAETARIVLLGPSHHVAFRGLALSPARGFATPLGAVEVDPEAAATLAGCDAVVVAEEPHEREHALEVELPFLQVVLGAFRLVPLVVGEASPAAVAEVISRFDADPETRVVVSTDLSHYLDYASAARRDAATGRAIVDLDVDAVGPDDACGRAPLRGLLARARQRGWRARELDRRSSGDTAGGRDRVVGYGADAFH
jgi:AmmeMemoRadiSam system protein B